MKIFGLIGYPLTHSWSPDFFHQKFHEHGLEHHSYRLFPLKEVTEFPILLKSTPGLCGVNVTIPYKETIIPFLHDLDPVAAEIGAVNTILISGSGRERKLVGYNTDAEGFQRSADFSSHRSALILGTGGGAKAVAYVFRKMGIPYLFVSRNPAGKGILRYDEMIPEICKHHTLIVHTSPLGMHPNEDAAPPIPYDLLTPGHFLYDLVYNPPETRFLRQGSIRGAQTQSGLKMLHLQAEAAFSLFSSWSPPTPTPPSSPSPPRGSPPPSGLPPLPQ